MKNRSADHLSAGNTKKKSSNHQIRNLCLPLAHLDSQGYVKVLSYNPPALR